MVYYKNYYKIFLDLVNEILLYDFFVLTLILIRSSGETI